MALLGLLLCARIGLQLLNPWILQSFIDGARAHESLHTLTVLALLFVGVAMALQVVSVVDTYLAENVGWTATNRLRRDLALHCLRLDLAFHGAHTPGELIERIDGDVTALASFFSRLIIQVLGNVLLFLGVLVLVYRIDLRVGVALTVFALVSALGVNGVRDKAVPYWASARQASAELFGFLEERLAGTEDIRACGAGAYVLHRFAACSRHLLRAQRRASVVGSAVGASTTVLFALGTALALGLSAYLYRGGAISLGTAYVIFAYTQLLQQPIQQLTRQFMELQQATAGIARIQGLFALRSAGAEAPKAVPLPDGALSVALTQVRFAYAEAEPLLQDLSFALEPGEVLGVLGRTGSGKTTLTRLLVRLYDPAAGSVRLGGVDLRDVTTASLRARVGMVTQEVQLFHASLRDNLTFFDRAVPDAQVVQALHELQLWDWYRTLPCGLDTRLAPGSMSAGQSQLLACARVFLKDPGLVILDEASSRLDPATEQRTASAVRRLLLGRTGIIIAHRLAAVARADRILILEGGRIAEYGPRVALARDPSSRYATLLHGDRDEALA
jgi:ABC-type multidrug transport system fused ATPase/permease subunit